MTAWPYKSAACKSNLKRFSVIFRVLDKCKSLKMLDISFCSRISFGMYQSWLKAYPHVDIKKSFVDTWRHGKFHNSIFHYTITALPYQLQELWESAKFMNLWNSFSILSHETSPILLTFHPTHQFHHTATTLRYQIQELWESAKYMILWNSISNLIPIWFMERPNFSRFFNAPNYITGTKSWKYPGSISNKATHFPTNIEYSVELTG